MDNKHLLGKRIKEIRKFSGFTQEKFSEMIGIETSSLSGIESGRFFPSLHVLDKMANVLKIELIEFFKFSTVDIPDDVDGEISSIIENLSDKNKTLVYKMLKAAFTVV